MKVRYAYVYTIDINNRGEREIHSAARHHPPDACALSDLLYFCASWCGVCSMTMAKFGKYEPLPRYLQSSGLVGGKALTYSGRIQDFSEESKRRLAIVMEEFDPYTKLWQQKKVTGQTPAPGIYRAANVAVNDDLFMFGGYDGSKWYI